MVRINKKYLEKNLQKEAWRSFLDIIKSSVSEEVLISNLKNFLTASEITLLEKRLAIPILLKKGFSYRKIGKAIDVSQNTISFVKHRLSRKSSVHRVYSSWSQQKTKKELPFLPPRVGHGRWLRAKLNG